MHIKYSTVLKNPSRKNAKYYGRIRHDGREKYVPLNTQDRAVAERWVRQNQRIADEISDLEAQGSPVPEELLARLLTVDCVAVKAVASHGRAMTLREALDRFEAHLRLEGRRERTVDVYSRALHDMLDQDMEVKNFTVETVKDAIGRKSDRKATTRRFYCNAIKTFIRFLIDEYGADSGLLKAVPRVKDSGTFDKDVWDRFQMADIVMEIQCQNPVVEEQAREFFEMLSAIGSRDHETAWLRWRDLADECVTFRSTETKSRKERVVPLPLNLYARLDMRRKDPDGLVFDRLPRRQSSRYAILRRALDRLGLTGNIHRFRHSVATILYRDCKDPALVAKLLGHSVQTSLKYYVKSNDLDDMRKLVERDG